MLNNTTNVTAEQVLQTGIELGIDLQAIAYMYLMNCDSDVNWEEEAECWLTPEEFAKLKEHYNGNVIPFEQYLTVYA